MAILVHSIVDKLIRVGGVRVGGVVGVQVSRGSGASLAAVAAVALDPDGGTSGIVPHHGRTTNGRSDSAATHPDLPRCLPTADTCESLRPRGGGSAGTLGGQAVGTSPRKGAARSTKDDAEAVVRARHAMSFASHDAQQERSFGASARGVGHGGGNIGLGSTPHAARAPPEALLVPPYVPAFAADRRAFPRRGASDHALPRHGGEGCHGGRNGPNDEGRSLAVRLELLDLGGRRKVVQLQRHLGRDVRLVVAYRIAALVTLFHVAPSAVRFNFDDAGAAPSRLCP